MVEALAVAAACEAVGEEIMELDGPSGKVLNVISDDAAAVAESLAQPERFAMVFDRYHGAVWAYLARAAGREIADELAGDVFATAFAQRHRYDPTTGSVRAWLYGIATNLQRSRWRSDVRRDRALQRVSGRRSATATPMDVADDILVGRQRLERVRHAMWHLSEPHRQVLMLFVWERLTYEEIASALGLEVGTVRSRLARARSDLRSLVEGSAIRPLEGNHEQEKPEWMS